VLQLSDLQLLAPLAAAADAYVDNDNKEDARKGTSVLRQWYVTCIFFMYLLYAEHPVILLSFRTSFSWNIIRFTRVESVDISLYPVVIHTSGYDFMLKNAGVKSDH